MGSIDRKNKIKEIRKNDIIDAAQEVIFSKGYNQASMDEISKQAEFSKRTVYSYFSSKEEIYFEIMVRGYNLLNEQIQNIFNEIPQKTALEKIKQMGLVIYKFSTQYPNYFEAIMSYENKEEDFDIQLSNSSRDNCYNLGEILFSYLKTTLEEGVKEGLIRDDIDVVNTSVYIWSSTIGLFDVLIKKKKYLKNYHSRDTDTLLKNGLDMIIYSIKKR
ncbi:MAG: TetR/AcrR family transcriptional regulator [Bacteroidales bacterium]|nr:TetR/AcrR family transcriptional regulator [Bacteroidales bacterium]